jgi:anti-anti-sigma factor
MDRFTVSVAEHDRGRYVVTATGELDLAVADGLDARLEPLITPGAVVVLDGSGLTFMDSSGLRVLIRASNRATTEGATFRVVAPQPAVRRVLELAGADGFLATRDDVPSALAG